MALKARLETLDGLPEAIAKEYKEVKEGDTVHYMLDAEGIEDVSGLKSALGKERASRTKLEKVAKKLGIKVEDETAVNALLESLGDDTLEEALAKAKAAAASADDGTKAVAQAKKLQSQLTEAIAERDSLNSAVDRMVRESAIRTAVDEVEGNVVLVMPHLLPQTKVVKEDGADGEEFVARVIDTKTKEVRMKGGKEMTLAELVEEVASKPEFADAFPGTGASGSGATSQRKRDTAGGGSGSRATPQPDAVTAKKASGTYNAV